MKLSGLSLAIGLGALSSMAVSAQESLRFNPEAFRTDSITMPRGEVVKFKAYEGIYYVSNVEDSAYQKLNLYVPLDLKGRSKKDIPVLMRNNVGGYMASPAGTPSSADASGRALQEGYVVCIPGARGNGSKVGNVYTGIAPNGLLDLKAATRWLHYNGDLLPANTDRIFTDGTSAGGAMSSLQGATGNAPEYEPYLKAMGAAGGSDAVFASICYCPITDLNHADMEYEWLYGRTNRTTRHLNDSQIAVSDSLAALAPAYINSLGLKDQQGNPITADNYMDYLKIYIMNAAQTALEYGAEIPDSIGIVRYMKPAPTFAQRLGAGPANGMMGNAPGAPNRQRREMTDMVIDVDWNNPLVELD